MTNRLLVSPMKWQRAVEALVLMGPGEWTIRQIADRFKLPRNDLAQYFNKLEKKQRLITSRWIDNPSPELNWRRWKMVRAYRVAA